jgi:hypothetical protein
MMKDQELVQVEDNIELENEPRPALRLITGGKGSGFGDNWLKDLELNTIFLARMNSSKELIMNNYMLSRRSPSGEHTNLRWVTPDDRVLDIWVPTLEFSRQFKLGEVLAVVGLTYEEEKEEEVKDGNSSGSVRSGGLPDDARDQEGLPVHEDTP